MIDRSPEILSVGAVFIFFRGYRRGSFGSLFFGRSFLGIVFMSSDLMLEREIIDRRDRLVNNFLSHLSDLAEDFFAVGGAAVRAVFFGDQALRDAQRKRLHPTGRDRFADFGIKSYMVL